MSGNILIVDDSPIDRKIMRTVLEKRLSDIHLFEADNGNDAIYQLQQYDISVCILDIVMPEKDGFAILEELQKDNVLRNIPIIVCTGLSDSQAIEKALTLGAYDYFTKPLSEESMKISLPLKVKNAIELKKRSDDILYLSFHDKLTSLYNRRFFEETISHLDSANYLPISFIIGDVNGLKLTNDAYGHESGDKLLKKIADILKESSRKDDIICRTGGDEFLLMLPKTTREEAEHIVAKIEIRCSEEMANPTKPSISLGVATKKHVDQDINSIYKHAEDRMYINKLKDSNDIKDSIILSLRKKLQEPFQEDN